MIYIEFIIINEYMFLLEIIKDICVCFVFHSVVGYILVNN